MTHPLRGVISWLSVDSVLSGMELPVGGLDQVVGLPARVKVPKDGHMRVAVELVVLERAQAQVGVVVVEEDALEVLVQLGRTDAGVSVAKLPEDQKVTLVND